MNLEKKYLKTQGKVKYKIAVNPEPSDDYNAFYAKQIFHIALQRPI